MKRLMVAAAALVLAVSCREEKLEPVAPGDAAEVQATAYNFHVFPGARFLEQQTDVLRRSHFVLHPDAADAPPMAMYEADAPVDQVAAFYAEKYGYGAIAENAGPEGAEKPKAYFTSGDLSESLAIKPITEKLGMQLKFEGLSGPWRGAHIAPRPDMPRVTLQRPYFDYVNDRVVDKTLILMVRE
ncbi:MAG TPA: hypothetical protein VFV54_09780 [Thermoanaerobaculia bacterium]|nr:hypothetical protein [Thermoanaerobaculia bacterium]